MSAPALRPLVERHLLGPSPYTKGPVELIALAERSRRCRFADLTAARHERNLRDYFAFCERFQEPPFPASDLIIAGLIQACVERGHCRGTIRNLISTINLLHVRNGFPKPSPDLVRMQISTVRARSRRRATPLLLDAARKMVRSARRRTRKLQGLRDAAIILIGVFGGPRPSEFGKFLAERVEYTDVGARLYLVRSKGDPTGQGQWVEIESRSERELCPVAALRAYVKAAEITVGPIFTSISYQGGGDNAPPILGDTGLSLGSISYIVKSSAAAAGFDPRLYTGRSLRREMATQEHKSGGALLSIKRKLRHKQLSTTEGYIEGGSPYDYNATRRSGL